MGFLDKAKVAATQAMQQGQAKVSAFQQSREEADLYKTLGEASYAQARRGGDQGAVDSAIAALDAHFVAVEQAAAAAAAAQSAGATGAAAPAGAGAAGAASAQGQPAEEAGSFTLDDM
jgi:D-arabinose 1-dehydrogenase-like Zn-dependent alcohol dehydrogenase